MASVQRRRGRIQLRVNQAERAALLDILSRLAPAVSARLVTARTAYDDAEMQAEYDRWVRPEVTQGIEADVTLVAEALGAGDDLLVLTEAQAHAWLRCFNHLRLAAGDALLLTDDGWETDASKEMRQRPEFGMLMALGYLQEELVAALES